MVKYLLSLLENDKDFDINVSIDSNNDKLSSVAYIQMTKDPVISAISSSTPLFAVAMHKDSANNNNSIYNRNDNNTNIKQEELECLQIILSHPNIDPHKKCDDKTLFIHCIENDKIDFIEYMFELAFNNSNGNNHKNDNNGHKLNKKNKYKFDFRTLPFNERYLNCLDVAIWRHNLEMFKFLLKNIIKYQIFTIDAHQLVAFINELVTAPPARNVFH